MNRFVIIGIVDDILSDTVRKYQDALSSLTGDRKALCFPVHVTLRGPFRADGGNIALLAEEIHRYRESCSVFQIVVAGPLFVQPDLCWLEVQAEGGGLTTCGNLHREMEKAARPVVVQDDVPDGHRGDNYRPHVTVGWGAAEGIASDVFPGPVSLNGTIGSIAVARYPDAWPDEGEVRVVVSFPLAGPIVKSWCCVP